MTGDSLGSGSARASDALPLIGPDDPEPFDFISRKSPWPVLLVCDHASNSIPTSLVRLGLSDEQLNDHIAFDIGAAQLTRELGRILNLPAVLGGYSRLVVDPNRRMEDPTVIPVVSDGISIPGNQGLNHDSRQRRADEIYWPYHHKVRDELQNLERRFRAAPALVAIHSFTPSMAGVSRPWHAGILWDTDPRIPQVLISNLRAGGDCLIGDNEPYSGRHPADFTVDHHAEAEGLPHVGIEVRQDLIATEEGARLWAQRLADSLSPVFADRELYTYWSGAEVSQ